MTTIINRQPPVTIAVWPGAPIPILLRRYQKATDGSKVYQSFASTVSFRAVAESGDLFTLTVGSGITLSDHDGVTNGLATIQMTEAQSNQVLAATKPWYEVVQGVSGSRTGIIKGPLLPERQT